MKRLLSSRADIFAGYSEDHFREAAEARFRIVSRMPVADTGRVLYLIEPTA